MVAVSSVIPRSSKWRFTAANTPSGLRGYDRGGWNGIFAPAGVPRDIVIQLNALIGKIVNTPEMIESLGKLGFEARTDTPEEFAAFVRNEMAQNAKLVRFAGLKPN